MKKTLSILLLMFIVFSSTGQQKKRDRVKRKYRNTETVAQNFPQAFLRGKVRDQDDILLPGAHVTIVDTEMGVHANENGEYFFYGLSSGITRIQVSFVGFITKSVDFQLQTGQNYLNFSLDENIINLDAISVTSQKREQQILDVPITMNAIDASFLEENNISELEQLSEFVPGMQIRMQGTNRPSFVIRGLTSDEISPAAQPRVSVFYNNVPINRASGAAVELFDMQQIEILKGPQGTLFGRGAQIGAIHYISNKPSNDYNGSLTAGIGNFNRKEVNGAINIPVIKNKLMVRAAGIYDYNDGYIKNTFGGNLNGQNTVAGRFSIRFIPTFNNRIDLVLNYQKDDNPGLGFMSMTYPNSEGNTNPFDYKTSLEQGDNLSTKKDIFDATLTMKHFNNENNFWTSTSSYREIGAFSRWDGDGTAATAIDMSEDIDAWQFYQELRYNFSRNNKLNGSFGGSYWLENASQNYWFSTNEQDMFHLIFNTGSLVGSDGQPIPITNIPPYPELGDLGGIPLATNHQEENWSNAKNQALEGFIDFNYQLLQKLSATVGVRVIAERFKLSNRAQMAGKNPSTLGLLTGNYPNLLFAENAGKEMKETSLAFTYRGGLKYAFNEKTNAFVTYSKGRRPKVIQFTSTGEEQVLDAEILNNYELVLKPLSSNKSGLMPAFFITNTRIFKLRHG